MDQPDADARQDLLLVRQRVPGRMPGDKQPVWPPVMTARGDPGRFIVQAREEGIGSR